MDFSTEKYTLEIKKLFEKTKQIGEYYKGLMDENAFFKMKITAGLHEKLIIRNNIFLCMYKYIYEDCESILMNFSLPVNIIKERGVNKSLSMRTIEIVNIAEKCFVTLDYMKVTEFKNVDNEKIKIFNELYSKNYSDNSTKFIYIIMIKKL